MIRWIFSLAISTLLSLPVLAQSTAHSQHSAYSPPGSVGRSQVQRSPSFQGYVQPVEFHVPKSATVAVAQAGSFQEYFSTMKVGLMVGETYRLKVASIDRFPGAEVYPSIEVINRLHPPEGQSHRFPIPVRITQKDLEHAMAGRMVVRVIYLENPKQATPEDDGEDLTITALPEEDPLHLADQLGRPMAILRMGSRVPSASGSNAGFYFGSPSVTVMASEQVALDVVQPLATPMPVELPREQTVEPDLPSRRPNTVEMQKQELLPEVEPVPLEEVGLPQDVVLPEIDN